MQIRNSFTIKSLADVQPGELISFELNRDRALGIALNRNPQGDLKIGVIRADGFSNFKPFHFDYDTAEPCISYGTEWEIEPQPGAETMPGNLDHTEIQGVLHATSSGLAVRFGRPPDNPRLSGYSHDLVNGGAARLNQDNCAPIFRWRIWASAANPRFPDEKPLFEFDATPPTP